MLSTLLTPCHSIMWHIDSALNNNNFKWNNYFSILKNILSPMWHFSPVKGQQNPLYSQSGHSAKFTCYVKLHFQCDFAVNGTISEELVGFLQRAVLSEDSIDRQNSVSHLQQATPARHSNKSTPAVMPTSGSKRDRVSSAWHSNAGKAGKAVLHLFPSITELASFYTAQICCAAAPHRFTSCRL